MTKLQRIEKQILLKAPRSRVWQALTDQKQFSTWFGHELLDPIAPGAVVRARVQWQGKDTIEPFFQVEAIEPERRFAFRWTPDAADPAVPYEQQPMTLVEFVLDEVDEGTLVTHSESGYDRIPGSKREWMFRNDRGWSVQVLNLERYIHGHLDELQIHVLEVELEERIAAPLPRVRERIAHGMVAGSTRDWPWDGGTRSINVLEVAPAKLVFEWHASGSRSTVTLELTADGDETQLAITEAQWRMMTDGVKSVIRQTRGWTAYVCALKAELEHGVTLRTGHAAK
jgi:uncharacterized protein YndB with AHSA1/START domain